MTDDELLEALGRIARERRRGDDDPRWEELARGELSEDEREALLAQEGAEELLPLFEPLGEDFADEMAKGLLRDEPQAQVIPYRSRARRVVVVLGPVLALAAALLLYVGTPGADEPLPAYALEVSGGDRDVRGEVAAMERLRLSPGSRVEVVARPEQPVAQVVPEVTVRTAAGPVPWTGDVQVSASGAVRLTGTLGQDVVLPVGHAEIDIALRSGHDGSDGQAARTLTVPILVVD